MGYFQARTDLALEAREFIEDANGSLRGVIVEEYDAREAEIHVTQVKITTKNGARLLGKPVGTYVTLEVPGLAEPEPEGEEQQGRLVAREISEQLKSLLSMETKTPSVLVVGLGNREVTADALGPAVVDDLCVTRHILREYGKAAVTSGEPVMVSAIAPGVMAKTGMETAEIVAGIVKETKPDALVVVDALAARSTRRLNRTIQISNTGIHPGSGVGNHRNAITEESLGIPVIAIGVPTVVDAATIVADALEKMHRDLKEAVFLQARESTLMGQLNNLYVTGKDVDAAIKRLSAVLARALNLTFGMEA